MMKYFLILCISYFIFPTFSFLYFVKNPDPEVFQNISEIIRGKGYECIDYDVITEDGYILSLQRIPSKVIYRGQSNLPVLLQHGLLDSAHTWVNNLANQSLGFILADAGYDVWLANSRGNTYSKRHTHLDPKSEEFWQFSWDEMAALDLPAMVDFVLKTTGAPRLYYIGHSQGTMIAFARLNEDARLRSQVALFIALGPVATLSHIISPIKYVAPFAQDIESVMELFGKDQFMPSSRLTQFLSYFLCGNDLGSPICGNIIFLLCGYDKANMNETRLPVYISHTPAGTSVQNVVHYSQAVLSKKFQKFDFGLKGNMEHYGQPSPPLYHLNNISTPIAFIYGGKDWLADPKDSVELMKNLPNLVFVKSVDEYNHLDFVWGENASTKIYRDIQDLLHKYR